MSIRPHPLPIFLVLLGILTIFYWIGVPGVPFHPDESTYIFTSSDADLFWQQPSALFWRPNTENDPRQRYRELDAPFVVNLIAVGRWVTAQPALPVDWDWSKTWTENQQQGAFPNRALLLVARYSVAALFPFSVLLVYLAARRAANEWTAWLAALLLASNALVLLHTRRAMAEGPLLFATALMMWALVRAEQRGWLTSIPAALAFSAKQTLAALAPVGLLAAFWSPASAVTAKSRRGMLHAAGQGVLFVAILVGLIFLFHPFLWSEPLPALQSALRARQALASAQAVDRPDQVLDTPAKKLVGMIGSLYITPPIFSETANYTTETRAAEAAYLANPLHSLFRSLVVGGILLAISLFGFITATVRALKAKSVEQRRLVLLLFATLTQALGLLALVPLPWQRYYLPLVPFSCLWAAYGIDRLRAGLWDAARRSRLTVRGMAERDSQ